jgi:hypothetical protein
LVMLGLDIDDEPGGEGVVVGGLGDNAWQLRSVDTTLQRVVEDHVRHRSGMRVDDSIEVVRITHINSLLSLIHLIMNE